MGWIDTSQNETSFQVEASDDGEVFAELQSVEAGSTATNIGGFPSLTHRYFRVRAIGPGGESSASNTADATTDGPQEACAADPEVLCLNGELFRVSVRWTARDGGTGPGQAQTLTDNTGYFWFFSPANVEMTVKVLTGCPSNQHYWAFAAGLTNVRVEMLVVDTVSGKAKTYFNLLRTPFQPILDTKAFRTCP